MLNNTKIKKYEILYLAAYIIYIVLRIINNSLLQFKVPENTTFYTHWIILALLSLSFIVRRRFTGKTLRFAMGIVAISLIVYLFNPNVDFLCIIGFIVLCPFINFERIIKVSIATNTIMIIIVYLLCRMNYIEDLLYRHVSFNGISYAHSYGFVYYSNAPFIILFLSCMVLYFNKSIRTYIILTIINTIAYFVFTAKLPFVAYIIMILLSIIMYRPSVVEKTKKILCFLPCVFSIISIGISLAYTPNNRLISSLNVIFNTRISQGKDGLLRYGLSIFGQPIEMTGSYKATYAWQEGMSNFFIDNDYIYMLLAYGIIFYLLILALYSMIIKRYSYNGDIKLLIWSLTTIIFALINSTLISVDFNPILLIGVNQIFNQGNKRTRVLPNSIRSYKGHLKRS